MEPSLQSITGRTLQGIGKRVVDGPNCYNLMHLRKARYFANDRFGKAFGFM
jgi:hypothetical protein